MITRVSRVLCNIYVYGYISYCYNVHKHLSILGILWLKLEVPSFLYILTPLSSYSSNSTIPPLPVPTLHTHSPFPFQLAVFFTDECDRFKDMTHVHSFTHDFHLRVLQGYVSGARRLQPDYHVSGFLKDFVRHYVNIPHFAINHVLEG